MTQRQTSLGLILLTATGLLIAGPIANAATSVTVGGAPMMSNMKIPENASKASNLTTLVAAVKAAGLVDTLNGDGPFTVFAPTNAAFEKLPAGTVDKLVKPDMKKQLTHILTYHVVPGKMTANDLEAQAMKNGGKANLTTVSGDALTIEKKADGWAVIDETGNAAMIETADVLQANGNVFVIDTVLMPRM
jgi:uncharacterized surface protein with fasciclin (FAS1) repeats